jgi:hypothetical protein
MSERQQQPDPENEGHDFDDDYDDEDDFQECDDCDGHDACQDFGCAIKAGIINGKEWL